ncbi:MAG TPA: hypothetical protein DCS66_01745 [Flavobacteriaceae bacterium]|nr:hypothetical protein [Flavobacteriaceae bacterium]|tara:strand:+ start:233 stop:1093 length:861 start_codon:yes stop_codon:yes gene_type:complete
MIDNIKTQNGRLNVLTVDCVKELHDLLTENALEFHDMEPISPKGVKNPNMLESAVHRQHTGIGDEFKYASYSENCATLVYGLVKDHAFHNGNKRAALLSMFKHLSVNGHVLKPNLDPTELYKLLICIAENILSSHSKEYYEDFKLNDQKNWSDDNNIEYISFWLKKNAIPKKKYIGEKIKFASFKKILDSYGLKYKLEGKHLIIEKVEKKKLFGVIHYDNITLKKSKYFIGKKPNYVKRKVINEFRRDFGLTKNFGVDNVSFYDEENVVDEEIKKYKTLIYRLSKT